MWAQAKDLSRARGLDNLLYSSDVFFSCFADLALTSPVEYYKEGEGSLMQVRSGLCCSLTQHQGSMQRIWAATTA